MRRENKVTREVTETDYICDRCGKKITHEYASKTCSICKKDVCQKCSHWFEIELGLDEPYFNCDNPEAVCRICWDKGKNIRASIMQSRELQEVEEERFIKEWKELCK